MINPITCMDYPDPDVIRVEDTYYMVSTTMYFMPGCEILRSYDLVHWEHASYVYDRLDSTPAQRMEDGRNIYGCGMWAASLRYHAGEFYVCFVANDTHKTYLYRAKDIRGPWKKSEIEGFYHDSSILFDDDGRVFIVYGNREIRMTELDEELTGPKPGGLDRIIVRDAPGRFLGYEGSHLYKINGKYILLMIHSLREKWFRAEACFTADSPDGEWTGGDVLVSDLDGRNSGVAQGGIVDTPDGRWFAVLFQDRGAAGRVPVLVPVTWNRFGYPVFGEVTKEIANESTVPGWQAEPLYADDDFTDRELKKAWQFNHEPRAGCWETGSGYYRIRTDKISRTVEFARNTLTQRTMLPACAAEVTVDAEDLREGDTAGLCLLIGSYGLIGVTREADGYAVVMRARAVGEKEERELARAALNEKTARLRAEVSFEGVKGIVRFFRREQGEWIPTGPAHTMQFRLDHFTGCRFGLYLYAQRETGGSAAFSRFRMRTNQ